MEVLRLNRDGTIDKSKNTLRYNIVREVKTVLGPSSLVYGKEIIFDIPTMYNNLSQLRVKVTATTGGDNTIHEPYLGTWYFSRMMLETKNGLLIAMNTPEYINARLDELAQSPIDTLLSEAMEPRPTFNNTTSTFHVPFFSFFSDKLDAALETKYLEQLQLRCIVAPNKEAMGLPADITAATYQLELEYYDDVIPKNGLTKRQIRAYDIYVEDPYSNDGTSDETSIVLTCNYPTFAVHASVKDDLQSMAQIDRIKMTVAGNEFFDLDTRLLFSLCSENYTVPIDINYQTESTTSYYFSRLRGNQARHETTDFIEFTTPGYANKFTCYHAADADKALYVVCEYMQMLYISESGHFSKILTEAPSLNKFITF